MCPKTQMKTINKNNKTNLQELIYFKINKLIMVIIIISLKIKAYFTYQGRKIKKFHNYLTIFHFLKAQMTSKYLKVRYQIEYT